MKRGAVLATLGLVLVLTGAASPQPRPLKIRLGVHASIMGAADVIAIRQGYFKQAGLEVEWRKFFLGKEGRDAMIAGAIDVNATAPHAVPDRSGQGRPVHGGRGQLHDLRGHPPRDAQEL
jgi:ABC-type nitrate/sulfonate/bicarbonate transport system substrate-binding protein